MSLPEIEKMKENFVAGARRAEKAGFQIVEIHGAHGYLLHEFFSPLSNRRTDGYGGSFENRSRLIIEIAKAIRQTVSSGIVLGARLSCVDWAEGGITIDDTVKLSQELKRAGVDFIDCSSGFVTGDAKVPFAPGFQVPFAEKIRHEAGLPTAAVGLITDAAQADGIIKQGRADMVFLAREMLRDPYWPHHAAKALDQKPDVPLQYLRGF
jgi:2,4-dienoyl-CoA reductase-like NADH-dependent reductase (Old Yellow Enzyme family)